MSVISGLVLAYRTPIASSRHFVSVFASSTSLAWKISDEIRQVETVFWLNTDLGLPYGVGSAASAIFTSSIFGLKVISGALWLWKARFGTNSSFLSILALRTALALSVLKVSANITLKTP